MKNQKKQFLNFHKDLQALYKMEAQKIRNLLNDSSNEEPKFGAKKWYITDSQTAKGKYNPNDSIKLKTKSIKSSLCDYSGAFILVVGDITVNAGNCTYVAFKNCVPFCTCKMKINDMFVQFDWI